jgi:hypothetical protein
MNKTRIALLGTISVLVAVWVSSATLPPSTTPAPAAQPPAKAVRSGTPAAKTKRDVTSFDLNDAAERLRARLATHTESRALARNPFEFGQPPAPRVASAPPASMVAPPPPADLPPPFALTGLAEHKHGDALERTAILTGNDQIYFAKTGDRVLGRYEVTGIGADAIELREIESGRVIRLGLR